MQGVAGTSLGGYGGAAAAAAAAASPSRALDDHTFCIVTGLKGKYEILDRIDRATARRISTETSLPLTVPRGATHLDVVTRWDEESKGRLCLGQGACGVFCIGRSIQDDRFVGLKLSPSGSRSDEEAANLKKLEGCQGTLQALDHGKADDRACQVIELAGLGSLARLKPLLRDLTDPQLKEQLLCHIARGILEALSHMHERNLYHLDVKPDNAVVDHEGRALLIDFDCSLESKDGQINVLEAEGDTHYDAPERTIGCWSGSRALATCSGEKLDSWSAGLLLLELIEEITLDPKLFNDVLNLPVDKLPEEVQQKLAGLEAASPQARFHALLRARLPIPTGELGELMGGLLELNPEKRLAPRDALRLPWFRRLGEGAAPHDLRHLREMVHEVALQKEGLAKLSPQDLPRLPLHHVRREALEEQLCSELISGSGTTVIHGASGSGKSHLAASLLQNRQISDHFGLLLWFRACDEISSLDAQLQSLVQELELATAEVERARALQLLKSHFERLDHPPLLVFDNAEPHVAIELCLRLPGQALVTTNRSGWDNPVPIGMLTEEEGQELVTKQLASDNPQARELCRALNNAPLALCQATAYIRNQQKSISDYLALLGRGRAYSTNERQAGYRPMEQTIRTTFRLTCEQIPDALPHLQRLACLAPGEIPRDLALEMGSSSSLEQLLNYSLVSGSGTSYTLHRLTRELAREELDLEGLEATHLEAMDRFANHWGNVVDAGADQATQCAVLLRHGGALRHPISPDTTETAKRLALFHRAHIELHLRLQQPYYPYPLKRKELGAVAEQAWGMFDPRLVQMLKILGQTKRGSGALKFYTQAVINVPHSDPNTLFDLQLLMAKAWIQDHSPHQAMEHLLARTEPQSPEQTLSQTLALAEVSRALLEQSKALVQDGARLLPDGQLLRQSTGAGIKLAQSTLESLIRLVAFLDQSGRSKSKAMADAQLERGLLLEAVQQRQEAIPPLQQSLAILAEIHEEQDPQLMPCLEALVRCHWSLDDERAAEPYVEQIRNIDRILYGNGNIGAALALRSAAAQLDSPLRRKYLEKVLGIALEEVDYDFWFHSIYDELCLACAEEGDFTSALRYYRELRTKILAVGSDATLDTALLKGVEQSIRVIAKRLGVPDELEPETAAATAGNSSMLGRLRAVGVRAVRFSQDAATHSQEQLGRLTTQLAGAELPDEEVKLP